MDKKTVYRAFNNTLTEFLDQVIQIVPVNADIKKTKIFLDMVQKVSPSLVTKIWYDNMYSPYAAQIDEGDITFFIEKEYKEDVNAMQYANEVLQGIQKIREPIRGMSTENKEISMKFIQKLSQLSQLFQTL